VLVAEDRPGGQRDAVAARREELRRDRKGVREDVQIALGEELHERERRRTAGDDDALAWFDQLGRGARDRTLLRHADVLAQRERHTAAVRLIARANRLSAAADALDFAALGERVDIAPDRRLGRAKQIQQIGDTDD